MTETERLLLRGLDLLAYYHGFIEGVVALSPPRDAEFRAWVEEVCVLSNATPPRGTVRGASGRLYPDGAPSGS